MIKLLVGRQNYSVVIPKDIKSDFNEYMFESTVCLIDELKTNGREQFDLVETLKNLITESEISVNIKFGAKGTYPVYPNILCFSNHINALPIPDGDRRFWVYRVEAPAKASDYYVKLFQWLSTDGPAHLYKWLENYDLGDLCITAAPAMTAAKAEMVESFKHEIDIILADAIEDREGPFIAAVVPADIIEVFVQDRLGADKLSYQEKRAVKMFIANSCVDRNGEEKRVRINYSAGKGTKRYPVIVRDFDKWRDAKPAALSDEMERAWKASLGQNPGANLEIIDSEEPNG